jgi:hypothetical protein
MNCNVPSGTPHLYSSASSAWLKEVHVFNFGWLLICRWLIATIGADRNKCAAI